MSALSNRSRFTRFSGSAGGRLDGFEVGLPGQFAVKQIAEDFVLKYRGLFLQNEFHWKNVRDRMHHRITRMRGGTVQGGYFPHHVASLGSQSTGARPAFLPPWTPTGRDKTIASPKSRSL